ncbi:MAG TPA: hypothetical protein VK907_05195, partial [Phnomibacter sp.]|nr:hypothetical protein [Phnomibacter sp.]
MAFKKLAHLLVGLCVLLPLAYLLFPTTNERAPETDAFEITERAEADPEKRWQEEYDMLKDP